MEILDCSADDPFSRFILTINVPVLMYGARRNDFDASKYSTFCGPLEGVGPENQDFVGP